MHRNWIFPAIARIIDPIMEKNQSVAPQAIAESYNALLSNRAIVLTKLHQETKVNLETHTFYVGQGRWGDGCCFVYGSGGRYTQDKR